MNGHFTCGSYLHLKEVRSAFSCLNKEEKMFSHGFTSCSATEFQITKSILRPLSVSYLPFPSLFLHVAAYTHAHLTHDASLVLHLFREAF